MIRYNLNKTVNTVNSLNVVKLHPENGSYDFPLNENFKIFFNTNITGYDNGYVYIKKCIDDSIVQTIDLKQCIFTNNILEIPHNILEENVGYYIIIDANTISNIGSTLIFPGLNRKELWRFNSFPDVLPGVSIDVINNIPIENGNPFSIDVILLDYNNKPVKNNTSNMLFTLSQVGNNGSLHGTLTKSLATNSHKITFDNLVFYKNNGIFNVIFNINSGVLNKNLDIKFKIEAPTTQSKLILFSNVTTNSFTAKFTVGNGYGRIVVLNPIDDITISVPTKNYTVGDIFENNNGIVVYNGNSNSVDVTNLQSVTTYYCRVYEYNVDFYGNYVYCTANGSFNPRSRSTI